MIKRFCDGCGLEIPNGNVKIKRKLGRISVEIMRGVDGCWNGGEVCIDCVINTVLKGEDFIDD